MAFSVGIFKNVFAIAAGCIDGLNLGDNAKSALITWYGRIAAIIFYFVAEDATLLGLSGLGDLIAMFFKQSRNWQLGWVSDES